MILSMTGYGKADKQFATKKIHAEIKSLNSKNLDLSTRIAPIYREKEMEIRNLIATNLERGKVDFCIWVEKDTTTLTTPINAEVASDYLRQIRQISEQNGLPIDATAAWTALVRMPDITTPVSVEELTEEEWVVARETIEAAMAQLMDFRQQEGNALAQKFTQNIERIGELLSQIEPYETARVEKIRTRLEERLAELKGVDYDKNRLEQELIYYIEKLDISEEKQRLTNHLSYFRETMLNGHGQGKKLGFIAQEMGREINTTGSKSNQAEMQNIVVRMKDELEQIKEQVLNVL